MTSKNPLGLARLSHLVFIIFILLVLRTSKMKNILWTAGVFNVTNLFWVSVEVEIDHDVPWDLAADGATQTQHLTGQQVPHQTNRMLTLGKI